MIHYTSTSEEQPGSPALTRTETHHFVSGVFLIPSPTSQVNGGVYQVSPKNNSWSSQFQSAENGPFGQKMRSWSSFFKAHYFLRPRGICSTWGNSNEVHRNPPGLGRRPGKHRGALRCALSAGKHYQSRHNHQWVLSWLRVTNGFGDFWILSPVKMDNFFFQLGSFLHWISWEFLSTYTSVHWQIIIR